MTLDFSVRWGRARAALQSSDSSKFAESASEVASPSLKDTTRPAGTKISDTESNTPNDADNTRPSTSRFDAEQDTCDMVANTAIPPHSEVFNTYGELLSNAQLLARYGFMLDENDNDAVTFDLDDVRPAWNYLSQELTAAVGEIPLSPTWTQYCSTLAHIMQSWPRHEGWKDSSLVYQTCHDATSTLFPPSPFPSIDRGSDTESTGGSSQPWSSTGSLSTPLHMHVNSEARISHALWVSLALLVLSPAIEGEGSEQANTTVEDNVVVLQRLADRQLYWETLSDANAVAPTNCDDDKGANVSSHEAEKLKVFAGDEVSFLVLFNCSSALLQTNYFSYAIDSRKLRMRRTWVFAVPMRVNDDTVTALCPDIFPYEVKS